MKPTYKYLIFGALAAGIVYLIIRLMKPRGERNNNPGNIKLTGIKWMGKVPNSKNTDGTFEQFTHIAYGIRALMKDLIKDIKTDGQNTIRALITEFAPGSENDTGAYINAVSKSTGFGADEVLTPDFETVKKLVRAITRHENGRDFLSDIDIEKAWNLI